MNLSKLWEKFALSGVAAFLLMIRVGAAWPKLDWPEVIGLALCLGIHYSGYRKPPNNVNEELEKQISQLTNDVQLLESKVSGIHLNLGIMSSTDEEG